MLTKRWNDIKIPKKIALRSNDDKSLKTFNRITSYLYGANVTKVWKTELIEHLNIKCLILIMLQMRIK